jgi:hypothetical protein
MTVTLRASLDRFTPGEAKEAMERSDVRRRLGLGGRREPARAKLSLREVVLLAAIANSQEARALIGEREGQIAPLSLADLGEGVWRGADAALRAVLLKQSNINRALLNRARVELGVNLHHVLLAHNVLQRIADGTAVRIFSPHLPVRLPSVPEAGEICELSGAHIHRLGIKHFVCVEGDPRLIRFDTPFKMVSVPSAYTEDLPQVMSRRPNFLAGIGIVLVRD